MAERGAHLRDLEWLIGTWEVKRDDSEVRTVYEWWGDKSFIRVAISIKQKDRTRSGFQMIGKDASTGQLRTWTFDSEGSFAEATVSRDGNKWSFDSAGVLEDGSILTATNIMRALTIMPSLFNRSSELWTAMKSKMSRRCGSNALKASKPPSHQIKVYP